MLEFIVFNVGAFLVGCAIIISALLYNDNEVQKATHYAVLAVCVLEIMDLLK